MKKQIIDYGIGTIDLMQEGNCYQFHLLRADLHIDNLQQLEVLSQPDALFLPLAVAPSADAEEFILSCELPTEVLPWSHAQQETPLDRLRLCLQLAQYYQRQDIRQTIVFAPENMFYDASFHPVMLYRGVCDVLEPVACTDEQLLLMYQALIITTLAPRHTFASLMRGGLNRAKDTRLVRDIAVATTVAEVMACVEAACMKEQARVADKLKLVPKGRYQLFARLLIVALIVNVATIIATSVLLFSVIPYQNQLLSANNHFVSLYYEGVIAELKDEKVADLPQTSKYQLAYSYIQGEPLTPEQRQNVLNNVSLKSDPRYLLYWIYNGQGKYDAVLDVAQQLGDVQLLIYGYQKQIEAVTADTSLSGEAKEAKLKDLRAKLEEQRNIFEAGLAAAVPPSGGDA